MTTTARLLFVCTALVLLGACSSDSTKTQVDTDAAYRVTINARPGDTYVIGGDLSNPFVLTLLNEGAGDIVVTCNKADYESPITLGPRGRTTRRIDSMGSATLTLVAGQEVTPVAVTTVSDNISNQPVPVDIIFGPDSLKFMTERQTN